MPDKSTAWSKGHAAGFAAGFAAAMYQAARIADAHRAMHLDSGNTDAGIAASSVSAFIVQAAREAKCWDDNLPQPLIKAKSDIERENAAQESIRG